MKIELTKTSKTEQSLAITVSSAKVNEALDLSIKEYRKNLELDGYRKGKVPNSVIESKYSDLIIQKTTDYIANKSLSESLESLKLRPISRIIFSGEQIKRDNELSFTATFEILPEINVPEKLNEINIEIPEPLPPKEEQQRLEHALQVKYAKEAIVEEKRLPEDEDILAIDIESSCDGKIIPEMTNKDFKFVLGKEHMPEISEITRRLYVSETGDGVIEKLEKYPNEEFRGKPITIKITLNQIFKRVLPTIDEGFAKTVGFPNLNQLNAFLFQQAMSIQLRQNKTEAEQKMLTILLADQEFELPKVILNNELHALELHMKHSLFQQGISQEKAELAVKEQKDSLLNRATILAKHKTFLLAVGIQNNIFPTEKELEQTIQDMAQNSGQKYELLYEKIKNSEVLHELEDRIIATKAREFLYTNINKIIVDYHGKPVSLKAPSQEI